MRARVAPRYAKSLLMLAIEQNSVDAVYEDMKVIAETVKTNRDFLTFLRSPIVKADKKISVIRAVFQNSMSKMTDGFITIITNHRRENILGEIAQSYVSQYKAHKNISTAEVISAVKLDAETLKNIQERLRKSEGTEIELTQKIDPDLIGGMIIRLGDKQYDGSIARKLNTLRKDFSTNAYVSQL